MRSTSQKCNEKFVTFDNLFRENGFNLPIKPSGGVGYKGGGVGVREG